MTPEDMEKIQERITALLLEELSPSEASQVRQVIACNPGLASFSDQMEQAIDLVRDSIVYNEQKEPELRLTDEQRTELLALFRSNRQGFGLKLLQFAWIAPVAAAAAILLILTSIFVTTGPSSKGSGYAAQSVEYGWFSDMERESEPLEEAKQIPSTSLSILPPTTPLPGDVAADPQSLNWGGKKSNMDLVAPEESAVAEIEAESLPSVRGKQTTYLSRLSARPKPEPKPEPKRTTESRPQIVERFRFGQNSSENSTSFGFSVAAPEDGNAAHDTWNVELESELKPPVAGTVSGRYDVDSDPITITAGAAGKVMEDRRKARDFSRPTGGTESREETLKKGVEDGYARSYGIPSGTDRALALDGIATGTIALYDQTVDFGANGSAALGDQLESLAQSRSGGRAASAEGAESIQGAIQLGSVAGMAGGGVMIPNQKSGEVDRGSRSNRKPQPVPEQKRKPVNATAAKKKPSPPSTKPSRPSAQPKPEVLAAQNPFSTFSLNVSDVSFKLALAAIKNGQRPEKTSIRSEEFLNAFDYHDPVPSPGSPLAFHWEQSQNPFAHNRDLIRFSIQTAAIGREKGRPLNLVVLLDNSGSMERSDRIRIVRNALGTLAQQLTPNDRISVVAFARTPRLWVDALPGGRPLELINRVGNLNPEGGTNLELALNLAYRVAQKHFINNGNNRVILFTDGAANLGEVNPAKLKSKVESFRNRNIALDCFGIGWEGFNDDLLEVLSRNGDGRYGFINHPREAASEFADQLAGALRVAASDVKTQIEFNPQRVTAYRQIGYEKHQLTKEQFRDNTVDAAEIGAAEAGTALYSVHIKPDGIGPIGTVRVRYKVPHTQTYREMEWLLPYNRAVPSLENAPPSMQLAAVATAFAELLADSPHAATVSIQDLRRYLANVPNAFPNDARPRQLQAMLR